MPSETECQADWLPMRHERQVYLYYVMEYVLVFNLLILCYGICFGIQSAWIRHSICLNSMIGDACGKMDL